MGKGNCPNTLRWYIILRQSWDGNRCVLETAQRKELKDHSQNTKKKRVNNSAKKYPRERWRKRGQMQDMPVPHFPISQTDGYK